MPLKFKQKSIVFNLVELNYLWSSDKSESEFEFDGLKYKIWIWIRRIRILAGSDTSLLCI